MSGALVGDPGADEPAVVLDEVLLLLHRERRADRLHEQLVERRAVEVVDRQLVEAAERLRDELLVTVGLEVLVGESAVLAQLLVVGEVLSVADGEVLPGVEVDAHRPAGDDAERGPAQQSTHRPREVVVQRGNRNVGRGVRVVDRRRLAVLDDRLARVELPPEERVHEP